MILRPRYIAFTFPKASVTGNRTSPIKELSCFAPLPRDKIIYTSTLPISRR